MATSNLLFKILNAVFSHASLFIVLVLAFVFTAYHQDYTRSGGDPFFWRYCLTFGRLPQETFDWFGVSMPFVMASIVGFSGVMAVQSVLWLFGLFPSTIKPVLVVGVGLHSLLLFVLWALNGGFAIWLNASDVRAAEQVCDVEVLSKAGLLANYASLQTALNIVLIVIMLFGFVLLLLMLISRFENNESWSLPQQLNDGLCKRCNVVSSEERDKCTLCQGYLKLEQLLDKPERIKISVAGFPHALDEFWLEVLLPPSRSFWSRGERELKQVPENWRVIPVPNRIKQATRCILACKIPANQRGKICTLELELYRESNIWRATLDNLISREAPREIVTVRFLPFSDLSPNSARAKEMMRADDLAWSRPYELELRSESSSSQQTASVAIEGVAQ